ncbi:hypothetical protein [Cupriavidus pauculus]|uniref:hypothetical protein n=1 Tax=Cupriavidus pauculus TaxID=82633 RepID=UPI003857C68C
MTTFDSAFERSIAPTLEALGFVRSKDYFRLDGQLQQSQDKTRATFSARPDWHHPVLDLYVETKSGTLNSKTTVKTAASAEARARRDCTLRGQRFGTYHMLQNQWSHSRYKQAAVQSARTPQNMIVVFAERVPFDLMMAYAKVGLVAIHLAALGQYLNYIRFVRRGLPVQWNLPYPEHGATFVLCLPGQSCAEWAD